MPTPSTSSPASAVPAAADPLVNALIGGDKWGGSVGKGTVLTYSFPWKGGASAMFSGYRGEPYSDSNEWTATYRTGLTSTQQAAFKAALQTWANVANITFIEVSDGTTSVGDIRIAFTSADEIADAWGYAYYPDSDWPSAGDIWINDENYYDTDWSTGSYNFSSLIHELGHALGLQHPYDDPNRSSAQYTLMSYVEAPHSAFISETPGGGFSWDHIPPSTPMLLDIAAIQYLYGPNTAYRTGNDVYTFDTSTPFFRTIWDAGGIDTIDCSNLAKGQSLDLNAGAFSSIRTVDSLPVTVARWAISPPADLYDGSSNFAIAYGVVIENATGGSGADSIRGNGVANMLNGGAGNDTLSGEGGNDTLAGGSGNDLLQGGAGLDTATYSGTRASYTMTTSNGGYQLVDQRVFAQVVGGPQGDGIDTLSGIERLRFHDTSLALDISGNAGKVAKLLGAVFGASAVSNRAYAGIGLNLMDGGMSYEALAATAVSASGKSSPTDICSLLWTNVVGAAPTAPDIAPYVSLLQSGQMSVGMLTTMAADTPSNTSRINLVGLSQTGLEFSPAA